MRNAMLAALALLTAAAATLIGSGPRFAFGQQRRARPYRDY